MADINITDRTEKYEELVPSENLKKEYHEFLEKHWFNQPGKRTISEQMFFTALYFANWQKQKMLEKAKSGIVTSENQVKMDDGTWLDLDPTMQLKPVFDIKTDEKVKVLILREND